MLLATGAALEIRDGLARGLAERTFTVVPRRFVGERLALPEAGAGRRATRPRGSSSISRVAGTAPAIRGELRRARWSPMTPRSFAPRDSIAPRGWAAGSPASSSSPRSRFPPGTRRGIVPDAASEAFTERHGRLRAARRAELARFERERQATHQPAAPDRAAAGAARPARAAAAVRAAQGRGRRVPGGRRDTGRRRRRAARRVASPRRPGAGPAAEPADIDPRRPRSRRCFRRGRSLRSASRRPRLRSRLDASGACRPSPSIATAGACAGKLPWSGRATTVRSRSSAKGRSRSCGSSPTRGPDLQAAITVVATQADERARRPRPCSSPIAPSRRRIWRRASPSRSWSTMPVAAGAAASTASAGRSTPAMTTTSHFAASLGPACATCWLCSRRRWPCVRTAFPERGGARELGGDPGARRAEPGVGAHDAIVPSHSAALISRQSA